MQYQCRLKILFLVMHTLGPLKHPLPITEKTRNGPKVVTFLDSSK